MYTTISFYFPLFSYFLTRILISTVFCLNKNIITAFVRKIIFKKTLKFNLRNPQTEIHVPC